jgi:uncharacterized protein
MTLQRISGTRIEAVDVLRGFTLFGIALIHFVEQYYAGPRPESVATHGGNEIADGIAEAFVSIFIMGKFFMIFSFLFGLSFFIQLSGSDSRNNFLGRFAWRLVILLVIGTVHHVHYRGDILSIYAILGFALLLLYKLPDKALIIVALLLVFNAPSIIVRAVQVIVPPETNIFNQDQEALLAYYTVVKTGSYFEILKANLDAFVFKMQFQVWSGRLYITLGLFLLGIYAGRKGLLEHLSMKVQVFKKAIRYALWSILACIVIALIFFGGSQLLKLQVAQPVMWLAGGMLMDVFNASLALIYVCWLVILFNKERWRNRLMVFYSVGRMGLTTYLMQTIFGTLIFFSFGLGLLFELGAFFTLLIGLAVFIIQIFFSNLWLKYYNYGPVEWLWRSLTLFKVQPMARTRMVRPDVVN